MSTLNKAPKQPNPKPSTPPPPQPQPTKYEDRGQVTTVKKG